MKFSSPIYSIKLGIDYQNEKDKIILLKRASTLYAGRYGLEKIINEDYQNKDIITKPDDNVKRLIKCLEYHKKNYQ